MGKVKAGLLPLYIKLYDDTCPGLRPRLEKFYSKLAVLLEEEGIDVIRNSFCRIDSEFKEAVKNFENEGAQCIITINMAYSPSLESAEALTKTKLPVVVLDTTETYGFGPDQDPGEIDYNHGIHGVMDLCNIIKRAGKKYAIAAGHYERSDVIKRTAGLVKAACAAESLAGTRVGSIGGTFNGMGDFQVTADELRERFGVELITSTDSEMKELSDSVTEEEIQAEIKADKKRFAYPKKIDKDIYNANVKACLAVRKWIEKHSLDAFSVNFLKACPEYGLDTMPFAEACKAMERGIGYAGEGDVLDAAFAGVLIRAFKEASFVEIFCPDWQDDRIFISHMGEMNYALAASKPEMILRTTNYTDSVMPMAAYACYKEGDAVYANIFRDDEGYCLLATPVKMLRIENDSNFKASVRGWMKPHMPVSDFLKKLSEYGATHHSMLIYGAHTDELMYFGKLLGMKVYEI